MATAATGPKAKQKRSAAAKQRAGTAPYPAVSTSISRASSRRRRVDWSPEVVQPLIAFRRASATSSPRPWSLATVLQVDCAEPLFGASGPAGTTRKWSEIGPDHSGLRSTAWGPDGFKSRPPRRNH
jgi:hypothetical protein